MSNISLKLIRDAKTAFLRKYEDYKVHIVSTPPTFKLRIGDYHDRFEAYYYLEKLRKDYKNAIIVKDQINIYPPPKPEKKKVGENE